MSNPTSNFGWQMPTATDLVTDLPADFEVFGQAVDTDFVDLLGGTTGQVLSKTSATDLDFTWVTANPGDITGVTAGTGITGGGTSGTVTVTNDMATTITTNGDLIYGTGSGTYTRRAIGSTGNVLTVAAGVPTWATPAASSSGLTLIQRSSFSNVATTTTTFDGVFTSTYKRYLVMLETIYAATATDTMVLQLRYAGPTTQASTYFGSSMSMPTSGAAVYTQANNNSGFGIATASGSSTKPGSGQISFSHVGNSSQNTQYYGNYEDHNYVSYVFGGGQDTARTYTGFIMSSSSSNITGTLSVYGLAIA